MGIFIDIVIFAVVVFTVWRGIKSGFIRGLVGLASLIICLILAGAAAKAFSADFSDMIRPFVGGMVERQIQSVLPKFDENYIPPAGTEVDYNYTPDNPEDTTQQSDVWLLSEETLRKLGIFAPAARKIANSVEQEAETLGVEVATLLTDKLSAALAYIAVFAVAFVLLAIICVVAGNLINLAFTLPGLHLTDQILGSLLGLAKGLLLIFFAATVLRNMGIITSAIVEKTVILEYLVLHNPVAGALGL